MAQRDQQRILTQQARNRLRLFILFVFYPIYEAFKAFYTNNIALGIIISVLSILYIGILFYLLSKFRG
jgi:hypothetical protein